MKTEFLALIKFQSKIQIVWVMLFVKFLHGRWGWQGAYKGEFADDSVSFDFSDANLKFFDNRDFSYDKNGRYNFNVYFLTNQGGETVRLFFYYAVYDSEPGYGKKGANDYYTYR